MWACGDKSDGRTYAHEAWIYDSLFLGVVYQGLPTSHKVDRYATDTGQYLSTVQEFDASYNALGSPIGVTTTREDGANRITTIAYDEFGIAATSTSVSGTNVPTLSAAQAVDPISGQLLEKRDENGTVRGTTYDGFGRPVLRTIRRPGDTSAGVLGAITYLGFAGGDSLGRRVVVEEFTDPVDPGQVGKGLGRVSTTYLDELGRSRYEAAALGAYYSNETMITGARTYDALGRIKFEADDYPASQVAGTAYGTTRYFDNDGSLWVEVRGNGPQPFTTSANPLNEVFPSVSRHSYAGHAETTTTQDADSLTSGSPQFGVTHEATTSAIGRVLSRSTMLAGTRLEYATFGYEPLGHQTSMVRYQDAASGLYPVASTWHFDSLGQLLELDEPTSAAQQRTYSDWGELKAVTWLPSQLDVSHSIISTYDALGRLTSSQELNNGVADPATLDKYTYDQAGASAIVDPTFVTGRLASASTPSNGVVFSYDGYGQINARSFTGTSAAEYVEQHGTHGDGSPAWVALRLPDNSYKEERVDYEYDSAARMRWMWFSNGTTTQELVNTTELDSWGRLLSGEFGGTKYAATYATTGRRLPQQTSAFSPTGKRSFTFTGFDSVGREVSRIEDLPSSPGTLTSSYDAIGRLLNTARTNGSITTERWGFTYDALGNVRKLDDQVGTSDATLTYLTTDRDQICSVSYASTVNGCNVTYDRFGNLIREPTRSGYDKLLYFNTGDVRSIQDQSGLTASFTYDAFGEEQGLDIVSGTTVLRKDQRFGAYITQRTQKNTAYVARQFPGPGLTISRHGSTGPWVFQFAEPGGTRFTADEKGNFLQDVHYTPFGQATSTGAVAGDATFTTEQWNGGDALDGFGLVQVGKRIYDPAVGRFLSRDPLLVPRTAATTNPYAFALNDPTNLSDPSGLDPCAGNSFCISASLGGDDANAIATAATLGVLAANFFLAGGDEPPMMSSSAPQMAAYSAAFDGQMAQHRLSSTTSALLGSYDSGSWGSNLVGGVGDGIYDMGAGIVHSVINPLQTVKGIGHALLHPIATGEAIGRSIKQTGRAILSGDSRALGHAIVGIAAIVGPGAAGKVLGEVGELGKVGEVVQAAEAGTGGEVVLFHGTDVTSARGFLAGTELDSAAAAAGKIDGSRGFFLATAPEDAEYFAARRGSGTVLQYSFSPTAVQRLGGLNVTPLGSLGKFGSFSGGEAIVGTDSFGTFNSLRQSGHITVAPFHF